MIWTLMGELGAWQTVDVGWRRYFRPRLLSKNLGYASCFGDSTPKAGPGQDSDLEQQKLLEVQSQQGVQWLVAEIQKDLRWSDYAVFGKQRWERR